ncbi:MAG: bis(5'-nucleosyl)-tetraphosphatase (symmetrical) YqeK [Coriobacteriia bacterium]|nr:bis(5'-nucleosyl)-tetraphosphatase (symmetrical) YqeK [Coriobacteriia bacterium]
MTDNMEVQGSSEEALTDEFYQARRAEMAQRVPERRFAHIQGVSDTAVELARVYGVDERKARLAGILHDWDKPYDDDGIRARAAEVGLEVDPLVLQCMPQTLHGLTAAYWLGQNFPQIPHDVLQAVYRHTTCALDMSDLDMIIYIADCLEPGRRFGRVDDYRAMVGKECLEELFFRVHGYWTTLIIEKGKTMHPCTIDVWNHYALRHRERREAERIAAGLGPMVIDPNAVAG